MFDELPKLLPIWHDATLKDGKCRDSCLIYSAYPDHGGAGVDVTISNNVETWDELKSPVNLTSFGSKMCCLPLFLQESVGDLFDPCLGKLKKQKMQLEDFAQKVEMLRLHMTRGPAHQFRNAVLSAYEASCSGNVAMDTAIPLRVMETANLMPKKLSYPRAEWSYTGGCMATIPISSTSHLLLHPTGEGLNSLAVTTLEEAEENDEKLFRPQRSSRNLSFGGEHIRGITAESPESYCCVRQKKRYHYVGIDFSKVSLDEDWFTCHTCNVQEEISSINMSNYIPGDTLLAMKRGVLLLQNVEQKKTIWQMTEPLNHNPIVTDKWWGCGFGSHPRSILYYDRLCLFALDLRIKVSEAVALFSLPNPFVLDTENIMLMKRLGDHEFQHLVATDLHLLIFDERYPQQPVMSWNHMLPGLPLYCDVKPYAQNDNNSDFVVVLGTQETQDVASFHVRTTSARIQPLSLSHPMHLSKPSDSIETLKLCLRPIDEEDVERFSLPLTGLCVVPSSKSVGYTVLQETSLGDVFYQCFEPSPEEEKTFRVSPGVILKPPDEFEEQLRDCLTNVKEKRKKKKVELSSKIKFAHINKRKFLKSERKALGECPNCNPHSEITESSQEAVDSKVCSSCGLHVNYSKDLLKAARNFDVLSGRPSSGNQEDIDLSVLLPKELDFSNFQDDLSQRFLKPWLDENLSVPNIQSEDLQISGDEENLLNPSACDLGATSSQLYNNGGSIFSQSATDVQFPLRDSQDVLDSEDIIPPSQEIKCGLYSSRKKTQGIRTSASTSGF